MQSLVILDNDKSIGSAMSVIAQEEGWTVSTYQCPYAAVNRIRKGGIDLLITADELPELSGWGVAAVLREEYWPGEIVLMSGGTPEVKDPLIDRLRIRAVLRSDPEVIREHLRRALRKPSP